jgi:putative ABC transport system ATP-binding protein
MTNSNPILKVKNISKVYELDGITISALKNISLEIKKGEFVSIVGPSGSGKSTLMHLIGALDTPSTGTIHIDGKNIANLNQKQLAEIRNQKIGFIFQQFNLLQKTSSVHNVELPIIYSHNKKNSQARAKKILEKVGLGDRLKNYPNQLSGGQQQRVAIARALINNPAIILADEPTGNLDSKTGKDIMELFKDLHHEGHTVIVVTHDHDIAKETHRQIKLMDGEVVNKL